MRLHIISFNIPFPPNYGGIIDVYYKLKTLHSLGVKIILHCYEYERLPAPALDLLCEKVYYYKRNTGLIPNLSLLPYNVNSRKDPDLLCNLLKDDYPILFEGLHSCYFLPHPKLKDRYKIYRESNIEHDYFRHLARSGAGFIRKCFYLIEAFRFENYQKVIAHADISLVVSMEDTAYLQKVFPGKNVEYMPSFHSSDEVSITPGQSDFLLYHGKLSVEENELAARYLITNVFSKLKHTCIVAGMNPSAKVIEAAKPYPNISIEANPSDERMDYLTREAQIHLLITFQATGLKLKLLNSLFAGRHVVVNDAMLAGTGLDKLCRVANDPTAMIVACNELMTQPISQKLIALRESILFPNSSNRDKGVRLCQIINQSNERNR